MGSKVMHLDGIEFHINSLNPRKVIRITKKLTQMIGSGMKEGSKVEIARAISNGIEAVSDDEYEELCLLVCSTTQAATSGGTFEMGTEAGFDGALEGTKPELLYQLMFEILKFNKFPLVRDLDLNIGELMMAIELSVQEEMSETDKNESTESPESSQKSSEKNGGSGESA